MPKKEAGPATNIYSEKIDPRSKLVRGKKNSGANRRDEDSGDFDNERAGKGELPSERKKEIFLQSKFSIIDDRVREAMKSAVLTKKEKINLGNEFQSYMDKVSRELTAWVESGRGIGDFEEDIIDFAVFNSRLNEFEKKAQKRLTEPTSIERSAELKAVDKIAEKILEDIGLLEIEAHGGEIPQDNGKELEKAIGLTVSIESAGTAEEQAESLEQLEKLHDGLKKISERPLGEESLSQEIKNSIEELKRSALEKIRADKSADPAGNLLYSKYQIFPLVFIRAWDGRNPDKKLTGREKELIGDQISAINLEISQNVNETKEQPAEKEGLSEEMKNSLEELKKSAIEKLGADHSSRPAERLKSGNYQIFPLVFIQAWDGRYQDKKLTEKEKGSISEQIRSINREIRQLAEELNDDKNGAKPETVEQEDTKYKLSRTFVDKFLADFKYEFKYEDLNADNQEEGDKKFKEAITRIVDDFVTHGMYRVDEKTGESELTPFSDLDGKGCLSLLAYAGFNIDKAKYKPAGSYEEGSYNFDTGNIEGVFYDPETNTWIEDHHGKDSPSYTSAAERLYKTLADSGLIQKDKYLDNFIRFINIVDNMRCDVSKEEFASENYSKSLLALHKFLRFQKERVDKDKNIIAGTGLNIRDYIDFFRAHEDENLLDLIKKPLTDRELKTFGLLYCNKKGVEKKNFAKDKYQKNIASIKEIERMEKEGLIIGSEQFGKIVVNIGNKIPSGYEAVKSYGFDTYVIWDPKKESFFVSSKHDLSQVGISQGVLVRRQMIVKHGGMQEKLAIDIYGILKKLGVEEAAITGEQREYLDSASLPAGGTDRTAEIAAGGEEEGEEAPRPETGEASQIIRGLKEAIEDKANKKIKESRDKDIEEMNFWLDEFKKRKTDVGELYKEIIESCGEEERRNLQVFYDEQMERVRVELEKIKEKQIQESIAGLSEELVFFNDELKKINELDMELKVLNELKTVREESSAKYGFIPIEKETADGKFELVFLLEGNEVVLDDKGRYRAESQDSPITGDIFKEQGLEMLREKLRRENGLRDVRDSIEKTKVK